MWVDAAGRERKQSSEFDLAWFAPRDMEALLERNGLRIEQRYGDHFGGDLDEESHRMIYCCCRAEVAKKFCRAPGVPSGVPIAATG